MQPKITYLFGAGASFGILPIVKEFNEGFVKFAKDFNLNMTSAEQSLRNEFIKIAEEVKAHSSVDTYARVLFLSGQREKLRMLKFFLSIYFHFQQRMKGVNLRYDLFFGAIMGGNSGDPRLPKNVRILSWNYDSQFELSAAKFYKSSTAIESRGRLPIYPKLDGTTMMNYFYEGFLIHKINGSADLQISYDDKVFPGLSIPINDQGSTIWTDVEVVKYLKYFSEGGRQSLFAYSWEENTVMDYYRAEAIKSVVGSESLVVVGYSFPTFNRGIDKQILWSVTESLRKIYIQAPKEHVDSIIIRVKALLPDRIGAEIVPITDVDEFYIPFEFEGDYSR